MTYGETINIKIFLLGESFYLKVTGQMGAKVYAVDLSNYFEGNNNTRFLGELTMFAKILYEQMPMSWNTVVILSIQTD